MKLLHFFLIAISITLIGVANLSLTGCGHKTEQKQGIIYHCPMHPTIISDRPGSCSICGMDLVPIEQEVPTQEKNEHQGHDGLEYQSHQPEGYSTVKINPDKQQLIGIKTAIVKKEALIRHVRVVGEVAHDPEMYQAQDEYLKTRSYGSALRDAAQIKLEHMGMSLEQIKRMETKGKAKRNLIVFEKDPVFWVYAYFYESDLPFIKVGQRVIVTIPTMNDEVFVGELKALRAHIDTNSRSVRGIVEIEDKALKLRPGLFANVDVSINLGDSLVIPTESVIDTGERQIIFVKKDEGIFEPRQTKLGGTAGEEVQVIEGVDEGEQVVIGANFMLDSESKLRAVIKQSGQASGGHQH